MKPRRIFKRELNAINLPTISYQESTYRLQTDSYLPTYIPIHFLTSSKPSTWIKSSSKQRQTTTNFVRVNFCLVVSLKVMWLDLLKNKPWVLDRLMRMVKRKEEVEKSINLQPPERFIFFTNMITFNSAISANIWAKISIIPLNNTPKIVKNKSTKSQVYFYWFRSSSNRRSHWRRTLKS